MPCAAEDTCRTPRESSLAVGRDLDRRQEVMDSRPWRQLRREAGNHSCCQQKAVPRSPWLPREVEGPLPQAVGTLGTRVTDCCPRVRLGVCLFSLQQRLQLGGSDLKGGTVMTLLIAQLGKLRPQERVSACQDQSRRRSPYTPAFAQPNPGLPASSLGPPRASLVTGHE